MKVDDDQKLQAFSQEVNGDAKALSLAEEYSLPPQEAPVEEAVEDKPQEAESAPVKNDETPQADETATAVEVNSEASEVQEAADKSDAEETNPAAEETTETAEEKPEIKIETAPADFRFPTTNQTRHCFTRYVEYHRCVAAKGDDAPECDKFAKYYRSLCPGEWVERWNEQRENGTFPGPL
uniref:Cytochrome c oxidase subunit n=1 Tax=Leersia perrieri TaxID=77586 RepID=A0A0D9XQK4_9ORYZ